MKEVRIMQCQVGKFNFASNDKNLTFSMVLQEDNKTIQIDGVRAELHYFGDEEEISDFENAIENIEYVFEKCWKYANNTWSSTDYKAQCLLFAKLYQENIEELNGNLYNSNKVRIEKQIADLQKELESKELLWDLSNAVNKCLNSKIKTLNKWIENNELSMVDMKEGSASYLTKKEENEKYASQISELENQLLTPIS